MANIYRKKTLKLTIEQNNLQNPNIELFIVNSAQTKTNDFYYYVIDCSILNKSRADDSIISASFIIQYKNKDSIIMNYKCEHMYNLKDSIGVNINDVAELPIRIEANGSCRYAFIFNIKKQVFNECTFIDYFFDITSTSGQKIHHNLSLIPFMEK